jgi:hypothetical protein
MKKLTKLLQAGIMMLVLIVLASCSTEKSNLTAIPKDAGFVMVVDGKAINEKGNIQSISESKAYAKIMAELSEEEKKDFEQFEYIFKDTKESGIAINDEFIMFVKMNEGSPIVGLNFLVLDKAKVDALFQKVVEKEEDLKIITEDGISFFAQEEAVIAWNEGQLLVLVEDGFASEAVVNDAKALLKQTADQSISSNENYSDFYAKKKDVSLWLNYDLFLNNMPPAQQMMITSQLPFSMKGTYMYAYTNFEKGKVVVEYETKMNDEMKKYMEDYQIINDDFDTDVLALLPETSYANAEMSVNLFNYYHMFLEMFKEKQMDTEMYTKQAEKELGVTIDELLKSFSGEIAITMHSVKMEEKTYNTYEIDDNGRYQMVEKTSMQPNIKYAAVIKYNNDIVWDIIEDKASQMGLEKVDGYYSIPQADISVAYINSTMLITNDNDVVAKAIEDGKVDPNMKSSDVADYLSNFPTYMELNLDIDEYPQDVKDYLKEQSGEQSVGLFKFLSTYKRIQIIPINTTSAKLVLELKDDSKNSLEVILNNIDETSDLISQN